MLTGFQPRKLKKGEPEQQGKIKKGQLFKGYTIWSVKKVFYLLWFEQISKAWMKQLTQKAHFANLGKQTYWDSIPSGRRLGLVDYGVGDTCKDWRSSQTNSQRIYTIGVTI